MKFTVLLMAAGVGLAKAEDVLVLMKADGSLFTTTVAPYAAVRPTFVGNFASSFTVPAAPATSSILSTSAVASLAFGAAATNPAPTAVPALTSVFHPTHINPSTFPKPSVSIADFSPLPGSATATMASITSTSSVILPLLGSHTPTMVSITTSSVILIPTPGLLTTIIRSTRTIFAGTGTPNTTTATPTEKIPTAPGPILPFPTTNDSTTTSFHTFTSTSIVTVFSVTPTLAPTPAIVPGSNNQPGGINKPVGSNHTPAKRPQGDDGVPTHAPIPPYPAKNTTSVVLSTGVTGTSSKVAGPSATIFDGKAAVIEGGGWVGMLAIFAAAAFAFL